MFDVEYGLFDRLCT